MSAPARLLVVLTCITSAFTLRATRAQEGRPVPPGPPPANQRVLEGRFATSLVCAMCHSSSEGATALKDAKGRPVAPFDLWRASMMANASRDPIWRAAVAAEMAATPSRAADIQKDCLRCHAPMGTLEAERAGGSPTLALLEQDDAHGQLARDGVSCTVCHQIPPTALTNHSGQLDIGDDRAIYGPHADPAPGPMRRHTGYTPTQGTHVTKSAMCATCHTLRTKTLAPDGTETGHTLAEQTPYLEWQNSVFDDERTDVGPEAASCQTCHAPVTDEDGVGIETRIARNPMGRDFPFVKPRAPFGRHLFLGGNTLVPAILRDDGAAFGALAPKEAFEAVLAATRRQLAERTARVSIEGATRADGRARFAVKVENLTGHKLPTGFPGVRRAWLRVRVLDAKGAVLAASGEHDDAGRLVGPGGAPLAIEQVGGPFEPHRDRVTAPEQVALYEGVMADPAGAATWRLLRASGYAKDDRLLPRGWSPDHPAAKETAPVGLADDPDFAGGGDVVRYDLPAPDGAAAVEVTFLFQTLSARFAAELFVHDAPEIARLRALLDALPAADRAPAVLATARAELR